MNAHTAMIGLIVVMIITVGGAIVMKDITQRIQYKGTMERADINTEQQTQELTVVNTKGITVTNSSFNDVQVQMRYDGEEALNLNDTFIQISTTQGTADLQYRNGSLTRDEVSGFYTK